MLLKATSVDQTFAIGRVTVDEERCVGKINPNLKTCFIPKNGKELQFKFYDVLVVKRSYCKFLKKEKTFFFLLS